jgi:hypothetical protein
MEHIQEEMEHFHEENCSRNFNLGLGISLSLERVVFAGSIFMRKTHINYC